LLKLAALLERLQQTVEDGTSDGGSIRDLADADAEASSSARSTAAS